MQRATPQRQKGIAVLTAILVVVIATVLAVNLLWSTSVDVQRTQALLAQEQARLYDLGGEELAKIILADDFRDSGPGGIDSTSELWSKFLVREFKDGKLEGQLVDQQGLFDLNSLVDQGTTKANPAAKEQFERLVNLLELDEPVDAAALAEATIDWIDPDIDAGLSGAEDGVYTNMQPPYRPANFWFTSISELQAVKGYTPEILDKLAPHITALPPPGPGTPGQGTPGQNSRWPINVNTTTPLVLASLVSGQTANSVESLVGVEYPTAVDFNNAFNTITGAAVPTTIPLGISSQWFLLTVTTSIGSTRSTMYSLLERTNEVVRTRLRTFDAN